MTIVNFCNKFLTQFTQYQRSWFDRNCQKTFRARLQWRCNPASCDAKKHSFFAENPQKHWSWRKTDHVARRDQKYDYKHRYKWRKKLGNSEFLSEMRALPYFAGIIYCVREVADDIHDELKTVQIRIVQVVKDLRSNWKQKDNFETNG